MESSQTITRDSGRPTLIPDASPDDTGHVTFRGILRYVPSGEYYVDYVNQFVQIERERHSQKIVACRISRAADLCQALLREGLIQKGEAIDFSLFIAAARIKAQPRFREVAIFDELEDLFASHPVKIEAEHWLPHVA